MQFECRCVKIVPFVSCAVIPLTGVKLLLIIPIVASESVDHSPVIDSWEKCFFLGHLRSHFDLFIYVLQIRIFCALAAQHIPAFRFIDVKDSNHW